MKIRLSKKTAIMVQSFFMFWFFCKSLPARGLVINLLAKTKAEAYLLTTTLENREKTKKLFFIPVTSANQVLSGGFGPGVLSAHEGVVFHEEGEKDLELTGDINERFNRFLRGVETSFMDTSNPSLDWVLGAHYVMLYLGFGLTDFARRFQCGGISQHCQNLEAYLDRYPIPVGSVVELSYSETFGDSNIILYLGRRYFLQWQTTYRMFMVRTAHQIDENDRVPIRYTLLTQCQSEGMPVRYSQSLQTLLPGLVMLWRSFQGLVMLWRVWPGFQSCC